MYRVDVMAFQAVLGLLFNISLLASKPAEYTLLLSNSMLNYTFEEGFLEVPTGQSLTRLNQYMVLGSNEACPWSFPFNPLFFWPFNGIVCPFDWVKPVQTPTGPYSQRYEYSSWTGVEKWRKNVDNTVHQRDLTVVNWIFGK